MAESTIDVGDVLSEMKSVGLAPAKAAPKETGSPGKEDSIKPPKAKVERAREEDEKDEGYEGMFEDSETPEAEEEETPEEKKEEPKPEEAKEPEKTPEEKKPEEKAKSKDDEDFREVKVNGVSSKVSITDLVKDYQLREASTQKMREAAEMRKTAEGFYKELLQNPRDAIIGILTAKGTNEEKAREKWYEYMESQLKERVAELEMSEEGRAVLEERRRLEREKREIEKQKADLRSKYEKEEEMALASQIRAAIKAAGLKEEKPIVKAICRKMAEAAEIGLDISPEEAANRVKEERDEYLKAYVPTLSDDELRKLKPEVAMKQKESKPTAFTPTKREAIEADEMFGGESSSREDRRRTETPMSQHRVHKELLRRFKK